MFIPWWIIVLGILFFLFLTHEIEKLGVKRHFVLIFSSAVCSKKEQQQFSFARKSVRGGD